MFSKGARKFASGTRFNPRSWTICQPNKYVTGLSLIVFGGYAVNYCLSDTHKKFIRLSVATIVKGKSYQNNSSYIRDFETESFLSNMRFYYDNKGRFCEIIEGTMGKLDIKMIIGEMITKAAETNNIEKLELILKYFPDFCLDNINGDVICEKANIETIKFLIDKNRTFLSILNIFPTNHELVKTFKDNGWINEECVNGRTFKAVLENFRKENMRFQPDKAFLIDAYRGFSQKKKDDILNQTFSLIWKSFCDFDAKELLKQLIRNGGNIQSIDFHIMREYNGSQDIIVKFLVDNKYNFNQKDNNGENVLFFLEKDMKFQERSDCYFHIYHGDLIKMLKDLTPLHNIKNIHGRTSDEEVKYLFENKTTFDDYETKMEKYIFREKVEK